MVRLRSPNLVRNGSFETGDLSFWYKNPPGSNIEVQNAVKQCGLYACRMNKGTANYAEITTRDFIPVKSGCIYDIRFWLKTTTTAYTLVRVFWYNEDREPFLWTYLIETTSKVFNDYQNFSVIVPQGAIFMRLDFYTAIGEEDYMYVDCVSVTQKIADKQPVAVVKLAEERDVTTKGWHYCDEIFSGFYNYADFVLNVINFEETGGTNPVTLDVIIQSKDRITDRWIDVTSFSQVTCGAGQTYSGFEGQNITGKLREYIRVIYDVEGDGTVGDLDFDVSVVLKR